MLVGSLFLVFLVVFLSFSLSFSSVAEAAGGKKKKSIYPDEGNNCLRKARVNNGIDCYTNLSLANPSGRTV